MTIKYSEISCFFPVNAMLGFTDIQDNRNSILIIFSDWPLVCRSSVGFNIPISIFRMFSWFEMTYRHEHLGQSRMRIFQQFELSLFRFENFSLQKNLLSNNLILLANWRFGFRSRLVLIYVFNR